MATKQNFKATFFDSTNGLGAHKRPSRTHTDATIVILVLDTVKENECHTARFPVRRFDCFDHLYKGILKQMIPHLKALTFSY